MLKCRDLARIASDGSMQEASLGQKMSIRFHLMMCVHCRRFVRQINLLGKLVRQLVEADVRKQPADEAMEKRLVRKLCGVAQDGNGGPASE